MTEQNNKPAYKRSNAQVHPHGTYFQASIKMTVQKLIRERSLAMLEWVPGSSNKLF